MCSICGKPVPCPDQECKAEANARRSRDAYRLRRGLAVDPAQPTLRNGTRFGTRPLPAARARLRRERRAQGLTIAQRRALLRRWIKQRKPCAYCSAPATTVDHVVPLALGGTHGEGNLTPACSSCNSSKCAALLIVWRLRRPQPRAA